MGPPRNGGAGQPPGPNDMYKHRRDITPRRKCNTPASSLRPPSVDDPGARQAPILLPGAEPAAAELERDLRIDREAARHSGGTAGDEDLRPARARMIGELHAERVGGLLGRHPDRERPCIGIVRSAYRGPTQGDDGGD